MKRLSALFLLLPLAGIAATPPAASTTPAETSAREASVQQQMAELQARMGALANRMAALSSRIGNDASARALHYLADSRQGMLGMVVMVEDDGTHVLAVTPGGPAERAGLRDGDIITAINGKAPADNDESLSGDLPDLQPGKPARLTVLRDGKTKHIEATPERLQSDDWQATVREAQRAAHAAAAREAQRAAQAAAARVNSPEFRQQIQHDIDAAMRDASTARRDALAAGSQAHAWRVMSPWWGLNLAPLNPDLGRYFGTDTGALVISRDAKRYPELQPGDVITRVGDRNVAQPQDAMRAFRDLPDNKPVTVGVRRHGKTIALALKSPPRGMLLPPPPPPPPPMPAAPPAPPAPHAPPPPSTVAHHPV